MTSTAARQAGSNECPHCSITFRGRHGLLTHLGKRPAYCLAEQAKRTEVNR